MSTDETTSRRDRLETLLPFYLNGTLGDAERAEVEAWLASDPAAAIAFQEAEAEYSATVAANEALRPPRDALARLSAALEREAGGGRAGRRARVWERLPTPPPWLGWIVALVAVALLAAQTLWQPRPEVPTVTLPVEEHEGDRPRPFVLVSFTEDATIGEISELLQELGLEIQAGPLPGGLYRVPIPAETGEEYDRISASLQARGPVIWLVAGSRPQDG